MRHAGTASAKVHANPDELSPLQRNRGELQQQSVQRWEPVSDLDRDLGPLFTLSNMDVIRRNESAYSAWKSQTCAGYNRREKVRRRLELLGGVGVQIESGCLGVWNPSVHYLLPVQVRLEVRECFFGLYRTLGKDILYHVLLPMVAFRRGPIVRIFLVRKQLGHLGEAESAIIQIWDEIAVINGRKVE